MPTELLYENHKSKVLIEVSSVCAENFEKFLNNIFWGADGFLYSESIELGKLSEFGNVYYVSLKKDGELAGLAVVQQKQMSVGHDIVNGYYMTNFAVSRSAKSSIYVSLMVQHATRYFSEVLGDRGLLYAYVEKDNLASKRIAVKHGYEPVGIFSSVMFLKMFCKDDPAVRPLRSVEADAILKQIKTHCDGQVLTDFDSSLNVADYYVLERDGKIVAGVQQDQMRWSVKAFPGISGYLLLKVLPSIPLLNKIVTPGDLRFIKFGNIFVELGFEGDLNKLIRTLLRRNRSNLGMLQFDTRCPAMNSVVRHCKTGVFKLSGDVELVAVYKNLTRNITRLIDSSPIHISIADK